MQKKENAIPREHVRKVRHHEKKNGFYKKKKQHRLRSVALMTLF